MNEEQKEKYTDMSLKSTEIKIPPMKIDSSEKVKSAKADNMNTKKLPKTEKKAETNEDESVKSLRYNDQKVKEAQPCKVIKHSEMSTLLKDANSNEEESE